MSMQEWAEQEVAIAKKRERGGTPEEEPNADRCIRKSVKEK